MKQRKLIHNCTAKLSKQFQDKQILHKKYIMLITVMTDKKILKKSNKNMNNGFRLNLIKLAIFLNALFAFRLMLAHFTSLPLTAAIYISKYKYIATWQKTHTHTHTHTHEKVTPIWIL